jgi:hypothetical protein
MTSAGRPTKSTDLFFGSEDDGVAKETLRWTMIAPPVAGRLL